MSRRLKALVGERGRGYARRFGRLRLRTKARKARAGGWTPRSHPAGWLREVVLSPEVDTYAYALANEDELARALAGVLDRPVDEVARTLAEAHAEPELGDRLAADVGWRVLWLRRRPALAGHHLAMWVAVRLLRPALVVETGILEGLGSRVVLSALARNAAQGDEGRLVSFDVLPTAGCLVPERLAGRWARVIAPTPEALEAHLATERVDLLLHDSVPTAEHQRAELGWALAHGAQACVTTHAWTGVCQELARATAGARHATFVDVPRGHFVAGRQLAFLVR